MEQCVCCKSNLFVNGELHSNYFLIIYLYFFCHRYSNATSELNYADVGTTAEIYEVLERPTESSKRMKAIGRQRFKLLETKQDPEGLSHFNLYFTFYN